MAEDEKPRASTTGSTNPLVDMANWRTELKARRVKFDDVQKRIYLDELAKHGLKGRAAHAANVSFQTVQNHRKNDMDFAEAEEKALQERAETVREQIEREALEGFERKHYKDGELVREERVYETPIRMAMLKRYDPEYRDKVELGGGVGGGVLIVPIRLTPDQWMELYSPKEPPAVEEQPID